MVKVNKYFDGTKLIGCATPVQVIGIEWTQGRPGQFYCFWVRGCLDNITWYVIAMLANNLLTLPVFNLHYSMLSLQSIVESNQSLSFDVMIQSSELTRVLALKNILVLCPSKDIRRSII